MWVPPGEEQMKLLKPIDVAETLSVSVKTLYDWVNADKIPHVMLFGEIRFRSGDIDNILKNGLQSEAVKNNITKHLPKKRNIINNERALSCINSMLKGSG